MKVVKNVKELQLSELDERTIVFANRDGKLAGVIIQEVEGWILRLPFGGGWSGHHETKEGCFDSASPEFELFIAD